MNKLSRKYGIGEVERYYPQIKEDFIGLLLTCDGIRKVRVDSFKLVGFEYDILGGEDDESYIGISGYCPNLGQWYYEKPKL